MYFIYTLYSESSDKYYVGYTQNPAQRLKQHNTSDRNTFTSKHRPWKLVALFEAGQEESNAVRIERFVKKQKSRKLIERMVAGEELTGLLAGSVQIPT